MVRNDHLTQIPFINLTQLIISNNILYIEQRSSYFLRVVRLSVSKCTVCLAMAHVLMKNHSHFKVQSNYFSLVIFQTVRVGSYWPSIDGIYTRAHLVNKGTS